ncbi:MAG: hypothetical protein QOG55_1865 [Acidobacteriaceae bacterium]|jgi:hypothetical protein|nr:hypothetical protein [Acidobacteriaceae bacterium]
MSGDTSLLEPIYADDYVLVRPNGDTLEKREILDDLRRHSMRFTSFEVNDVLIRIRGMVGILTADVRSTAMRVGVEVKTRARQLAIVSKEKSKITLFHFNQRASRIRSDCLPSPRCPAAFERASRILASDSLLVHIENIRAFKAQTPNKNGLSYNEPISSSREIIVLTLSWLAGSGGRWPGRASLNSRIEINFLISLAR